MKRKSLSVFLVWIIILVLLLPLSACSAENTVGVIIDGKDVVFDSSSGFPYIDSSGRTQVPLRKTMATFGCNVSWNDEEKCAVVSKDNCIVEVPVGEKYILRNGVKIPNDTASVIKNDRTYLPIRVVLESFGGFVGWDSYKNSVTVSTVSKLMQIHFLDVGQGDSALIDFGEYEVLIDAGENDYGKHVCSAIEPYIDGNIELIIATHPDSDHIGGMDDVLKKYTAERVIDSGKVTQTKTYNEYIEAVKNEGCIFENDSDALIELGGGAFIKIIETGDNYDNNNDMSVIALVSYGNTKVLFTGDMGQSVERNNLGLFEDVDVLKVGHHGSKTSTSKEFLSIVRPEYAIISAGINNKYSHPSSEALSRLFSIGTKVLGTFKDGDIVLNINKDSMGFNKSNYLTLSDSEAKKEKTTSTAVNSESVNYYIGNNNTKVFHKDSCSSVSKIKEENKRKFYQRDDAINNGFSPCSSCNP